MSYFDFALLKLYPTLCSSKSKATKAGVSWGNCPVFRLAGAKQENEGKPFLMGGGWDRKSRGFAEVGSPQTDETLLL